MTDLSSFPNAHSSAQPVLGRLAVLLGLALAGNGCLVAAGADEPVATSAQAATLNGISRESFDAQGRQGTRNSYTPYISGNQRYVVFASEADAWAPGVDNNGLSDVFLKDRQTGSITLVSATNGVVGNGESFNPSVADDGTVVFESTSTNLGGATGAHKKILARTSNGVITRVDRALAGQPNGAASRPKISGNGGFVVFESDASNLVAGDTNGLTDAFVRNLSSTAVTRVSVIPGGAQANGASFLGSISYDGTVVAFSSDASNIRHNDTNNVTDVFAYNLQTAISYPISFSTTGMGGSMGNGPSTAPQISGNGALVSFISRSTNWDLADTNSQFDAYVKGVGTGFSPARVSVSTSGAQANLSIDATAISYGGEAIAFVTYASTLVAGDTNGAADVFVRDRNANQTIRVNQAGATQANGSSGLSAPRFSGNPAASGYSFLVFDSGASNLVSNDTNGVSDVFSVSLSP